jgi:hypothetical protein
LFTITLAKKGLQFGVTEDQNQDREDLLASTFPFLSDDYSCRGLEHLICSEVSQLRSDRRKQARTAVYHEQLRQYKTNSRSPERIAEVCRDISEASQREAHARALQHASEEEHEYSPPLGAGTHQCSDQDMLLLLQQEQDAIKTLQAHAAKKQSKRQFVANSA